MCDVCGGKIKKDLNFKPAIRGGVICADCANLCDNYQFKTLDAVKAYYGENSRRAAIFTRTGTLRSFLRDSVVLDERNRLFYVSNEKPPIYYTFDEIEDFGFEEIGSQVKSKRRLDWSNIALGAFIFIALGAIFLAPLGALVGRSQRKDVESKVSRIVALKISLNAFNSKKTVFVRGLPKGLEKFLNDCTSREVTLDSRIYLCRHCGQSEAIAGINMGACRCHEYKY